MKVDICPGGECPTKCGFRNDSIDCLLVDNNGFIVVAEELTSIGRSLVDYDDSLMQSLVERRVFHKIQMIDYQAICSRNDQMTSDQQRVAAAAASGAMGSVPGGNITAMLLATAAASSSSSSSSVRPQTMLSPARLELAQSLVANLAAGLVWTVSTLYSALLLRSAAFEPEDLFGAESLIGRLHQWQRSALIADAQSASANQSLLAALPNKTYLRPCETTVTLYETRPNDHSSKLYSDAPEYYETKCGCSAWYVYDAVPKTNLIVLIVNTTSACRRCDSAAQATGNSPLAQATPFVTPLVDLSTGQGASLSAKSSAPNGRNPSPEEQVCAMLERDQPLYVQKPSSCLAHHPDESQIHICGRATHRATIGGPLALLSVIVTILTSLDARHWMRGRVARP